MTSNAFLQTNVQPDSVTKIICTGNPRPKYSLVVTYSEVKVPKYLTHYLLIDAKTDSKISITMAHVYLFTRCADIHVFI